MQQQARPMVMAGGYTAAPTTRTAQPTAYATSGAYSQPMQSYSAGATRVVGQVGQPMIRPATTYAGAQPQMYSQVSTGQPMTGQPMTGQPMTSYSTAGTVSQPIRYAGGALTTSPSTKSAPVQGHTSYVTQTAGQHVKPNVTAGPSYTVNAYEEKHHDDHQLNNLKELRKTSGLKSVPVSHGLNELKAAATEGKLTRDQFLAAYLKLLEHHSIPAPPVSVQNAVFDLFDRDDNHVVDMMEIICGISLLCAGTEDDKIHAVFDIFDENGDGFISMDEMFKFLTSVFKVVLTPHVMAVMNTMGVTVDSAEDLASVTALECFKTVDLNHDGKLSVTEFKNWFYAPRNDPSFLFSPVRKLLQ